MAEIVANVRTRARPNPSTDPADAEQPRAETKVETAEAASTAGMAMRRSRIDMAVGSGGSTAEAADSGDWMHSSDDGIAAAEEVRRKRAEQDAAKAAQPFKPMRYRLAHDVKDANGNYTGVGETGDIVILDAKPGPRFWEHRVANPRTGYYNRFEQCPHEWDNCPLCPPEGEKSPYFVMVLSVIDMRPYTDAEGFVWEATRKVLPVKIEQQGFFDDLYRQHGSLRGIRLIMTRDGGKMSAEIGNNIQFYGIHTDAEMEGYCKEFGLWAEYAQPNGRVLWTEGEFIQPFQYGRIFEKPSGKKLRDKYRAQETTGSHIGGNEQQGSGWRRNTDPGRAGGNGGGNGGGGNRGGAMGTRSASSRRVNLDDNRGGPGNTMSETLDDDIPF